MWSMEHVVERCIQEAAAWFASDIHFDPTPTSLEIRFRIAGQLMMYQELPLEYKDKLITYLKLQSDMDIGERRRPQDGRFTSTVNARGTIECRTSSLPTLHGERLVLRLHGTQKQFDSLQQLGMLPVQEQMVDRFLQASHGLILITGPTGSGKTTTIYTLLQPLLQKRKNIISLEDPVEYPVAGIHQVVMETRHGFSYAEGLRALLRQDPDVIVVGEIRDEATAHMVIRASLTGHLVLSTMHTSSTIGALMRLRELGISPALISNACIGIIAQRLQPIPCRHHTSPECPHCKGTGVNGRRAIFEVLEVKPELFDYMVNDALYHRLHQWLGQNSDFLSLDEVANLLPDHSDAVEQLVLPLQLAGE